MTKRNIGQEILESIRSVKRGEGKKYTFDIPLDIKLIRERMNIGHSAFASLLGAYPKVGGAIKSVQRIPTVGRVWNTPLHPH